MAEKSALSRSYASKSVRIFRENTEQYTYKWTISILAENILKYCFLTIRIDISFK